VEKIGKLILIGLYYADDFRVEAVDLAEWIRSGEDLDSVARH
jgi:hypothetical protein